MKSSHLEHRYRFRYNGIIMNHSLFPVDFVLTQKFIYFFVESNVKAKKMRINNSWFFNFMHAKRLRLSYIILYMYHVVRFFILNSFLFFKLTRLFFFLRRFSQIIHNSYIQIGFPCYLTHCVRVTTHPKIILFFYVICLEHSK